MNKIKKTGLLDAMLLTALACLLSLPAIAVKNRVDVCHFNDLGQWQVNSGVEWKGARCASDSVSSYHDSVSPFCDSVLKNL